MPPFPSGEISLARCTCAHRLPDLEATGTAVTHVAVAATSADITRQFIRAKRPCADGYRWYLRRQEGASNYQALLDDLVREGRVDDACWMLDQFGPTNDVLELEHLEADALVFAGSVRCAGSADVDGVLRTGRSLSVRGSLRVGGALTVGEDLRVSGAARCNGSVRLHGDARIGGSLAAAQRMQCAASLRVGGELTCAAAAHIAGHCAVRQNLQIVGELDCAGGIKVGGHLHGGAAVQAARGLQVAGDVDCGGHLQIGWGVRAEGHIRAAGAIRAGESLWAGGPIAAGDTYGVYAGLAVPLPDWPTSARVRATEQPARLLSGCWTGPEEEAP